MKIRFGRFFLVVSLALGVSMVLDGCGGGNGTATINFTQVGACNGWKEGNDTHAAGPNAAYVIFKVHNIDNTQGTVNFAFDPSKMYVNITGRPHMDPNLSLAHFIGVFQLVPTTVPAKQLVGLDGYAVTVVQTSNVNGSVEANQTSYFLGYDAGSGDPSVVLAKMNSSQTSWPNTEDCTTITFQ